MLQLIGHQKILNQRNALLKYFALNHTFENDTLTIYNEQLHQLAQPIFEKRKKFIAEFIPIFNHHHQAITNQSETVNINYDSYLFESDTLSLLSANLQKDRALHYTSTGIHKDDLHFEIEGYPIKKFGSQGQQKSFLIALKQGIQQQERSDPTMLTMRQQAVHGEAIQMMAGTEDEKWHAKPDGMSGGCIIPVQDLDRCGRWLVAVRRLASDRRKVEKPIDRHAN